MFTATRCSYLSRCAVAPGSRLAWRSEYRVRGLKGQQNQSCCGVAFPCRELRAESCERDEKPTPEDAPRRPPFLTRRNSPRHRVCLTHWAHKPEDGAADGQQSSVEERLCRSRSAESAMGRGAFPRWLVGNRIVVDACGAPVAWGLGCDVGGCRRAGLDCVVVAPSVGSLFKAEETKAR